MNFRTGLGSSVSELKYDRNSTFQEVEGYERSVIISVELDICGRVLGASVRCGFLTSFF